MRAGLDEIDPWRVMQGVQTLQGISRNKELADERKQQSEKVKAIETAAGHYAKGMEQDPATARQYAIDTKRREAEEYNKGGMFGGAFRSDQPTEYKPGVLSRGITDYYTTKVNEIKSKDTHDAGEFYKQLRANPKMMHNPEFGRNNPVALNSAIAQMRREDSEQAGLKASTAQKRLEFGAQVATAKNATSVKADEYIAAGKEKLAIDAIVNFVNKGTNNMPHNVKKVSGGLIRYVEYDGENTYDYGGGESGDDPQKAKVYSASEANTMLKNITDSDVITATAQYAKATADKNYQTFTNPDIMLNPKTGQIVSMSRASDPHGTKFEFIITDRETNERTKYKNAKELKEAGFLPYDKDKKTGATGRKGQITDKQLFDIALEQVLSDPRYTVDPDTKQIRSTAGDKLVGDIAYKEAYALIPRLRAIFSGQQVEQGAVGAPIAEDDVYSQLGGGVAQPVAGQPPVIEPEPQQAVQTSKGPWYGKNLFGVRYGWNNAEI